MHYRSRIRNQDFRAAQQYFRNLVEAHATGSLSEQALKQVLGPGDYAHHLDKSMTVIPQDQIVELEHVPLGTGTNGIVYAARWERPGGVLATTKQLKGRVLVVLKEIKRGEANVLITDIRRCI